MSIPDQYEVCFPHLNLIFQTPTSIGNIIRAPPDNTGNEPLLHIHIGGRGQNIKNTN